MGRSGLTVEEMISLLDVGHGWNAGRDGGLSSLAGGEHSGDVEVGGIGDHHVQTGRLRDFGGEVAAMAVRDAGGARSLRGGGCL